MQFFKYYYYYCCCSVQCSAVVVFVIIRNHLRFSPISHVCVIMLSLSTNFFFAKYSFLNNMRRTKQQHAANVKFNFSFLHCNPKIIQTKIFEIWAVIVECRIYENWWMGVYTNSISKSKFRKTKINNKMKLKSNENWSLPKTKTKKKKFKSVKQRKEKYQMVILQ